jgi:hypothetical protein
MPDRVDADLVHKIASELAAVRQRGVDSIDLKSSKQSPLELPELECLAGDHAARVGTQLPGRLAQVRRLLRDSLQEFAEAGHPSNARFVEALFFDPEDSDKRTLPGDRLNAVKRKTGLSESAFEDKRRTVFREYAEFVALFVRSKGMAAPVPPRPWTRRAAPVAAGIAVLVMLGTGAVVAWSTGLLSGDGGSPAQSNPDGPDPPWHSPGVSLTIGPPPDGIGTITEQQGSFGAPTFSDPFDPAVTGWTVPAWAYVEISCKIYAPTMASVTPDGYWYRIASSPWKNEWYAVANTFWNGDVPGEPAEHHTNFDIPDCEM